MGLLRKKKKTHQEEERPPPYVNETIPQGQNYGNFSPGTDFNMHPHYTNDVEEGAERRERSMRKRKRKKISQKGRNTCIPNELKAMVALITILLAIFDLYTDIQVLRTFVLHEMSYLTYAMICIVFVSSLIFFLQMYAFYLRCKSLCSVGLADKEPEERDAVMHRRENRFLCCAETSSYLLLVLEDGPALVLLVLVTLIPGVGLFADNDVDYCGLYAAMFEQSHVGWLSLLATFVVTCWKLLLSFFYCSACCCMEWGGIEGFCLRCCCCFFRIIRPLYAVSMVGAAFYLYHFYRIGYLVAQRSCVLEETAVDLDLL